MKKTTKFLCIVLALACVAAFFAGSVPSVNAADSDYQAYRLKSENLLYPSHYYSTVEMTDTPIEHTFVKVASLYPVAAVDNSNKSALCSKPYKFNELYDNYVKNGSTGKVVIPCCVIDLALGGDPVEIAGFGMTLRSHFDCKPIHLKIQVATDAAATNWETVCDAQNLTWDSISKRWYFDPINAYQVRVVALDIDEVNLSEEGDYYDTILGDETRFTYAEVDVFTLKENSGDSTDTTPKPTTPGVQTPTRPNIVTPTRPITTTATQAPTKAPTQPATQAPTTGGQTTTQPATKAPTQPATKAPDQPATQAPTTATVAPTTPSGTVTPTEPTGTVDPSAPTEPTGTVDPNAPTEETVDPSAPTDEPTVAPTDEPTVAPTVEATEPQATTGTTDNGTEEAPKDFPWIIVVIIAAAAVVAGGAAFFIIKKKKQG